MRFIQGFLLLIGLTVLNARVSVAQELVGVVTDSTGGHPIAGATIVAIGADGTALGRTLSDGVGRFRMVLLPNARALRVVRLGFRPVTRDLPTTTGSARPVEIAMVRMPVHLAPISITAARRPKWCFSGSKGKCRGIRSVWPGSEFRSTAQRKLWGPLRQPVLRVYSFRTGSWSGRVTRTLSSLQTRRY